MVVHKPFLSKHNSLIIVDLPIRSNELWDKWEANLSALCEEVSECEGATNLVELLSAKGVPLAIATSSRMGSVQRKRLRHERIFQSMSVCVTGDDPSIKNGKPAPDIYLEAAHRLGVDPELCLVFEDSISGCQSARDAGCVVVAVPDPRMEVSNFDGISDCILDNLSCFDPSAWGM